MLPVEINGYSIFLFLCSILTTLLPVYLFAKVRSLGKYLGYLMLAAALWAFAYALELMQTNLARMITIVKIEYIGIAFLPAFWMLFVLKFLGKETYLRIRYISLLFLVPLVTVIMVWSNEWHRLHYTIVYLEEHGNFNLFKFQEGPWYIVFTIYYYLVLLLSVVLLLKSKVDSDVLLRKQKRFLVAGALVPWFFNMLYLLGIRPSNGIDLTPFAFMISSFCFTFALLKYQLFNILPIAREQIVEALQEGVLVIDNEERIIDFNPKMASILALDASQLAGQSVYQLLPDLECIERISSETEITVGKSIVGRTYALTISDLYDKKGRIRGKILLFKDVTERKESEIALLKAKEAAELATLAKDQFLSTMSHEIRTPMNSILGFTHLLLQNNPREDQKEFLGIQRFSAENLLVLINDILDFSKIQSGKLHIEETPVDFTSLLQNIYATLKNAAAEKGIDLVLTLPAEGLPTVLGDPVRLSQIFVNLAGNAIKFTEKGRVEISAEALKIEHERTTVLFRISDTGIGIDPDKIDQIFESFTQASADTTRRFGGSGLGLTITKQLLRLMKSDVSVSSMPGKGSVFSFQLELKNAADQQQQKIVAAKPDENLLVGKNVLIVDDNAMNVLLAKQFLKKWNIRFGIAKNGLEALNEVQSNDYDLVLMDLQMPEMDGYTATREIRRLPDGKFRELPIIALSASALAEVQEKVFEAGMTDFLTKPFTPDTLFDKLRSNL
ncbi:histidine kinase N-terminal 7TM domain-containing protein [Pedobacter sp. SYSU D00535]|uniref:histidine kinase N-terminal 7TM domain-containing protein n=1 Tax=Pedobacter sp. SYSU D00535 TaxID=2810308 RepID=UPI001A975332|nr:histidine kinase N-terminal 7TM domain-containing protein [Pedobacter sp. SYSU D00535]